MLFGVCIIKHSDETEVEHMIAPHPPRVTLIENFASHAAVQELVDVKPD